MTQVAEGVRSTPVAVELGDMHGLDMPICKTINSVLPGTTTAQDAYTGLRRVPAGHEAEPW